MARTCTICSHKDSEKINKELIEGTPYRDIAGRFGVSRSALERHKENHLPGGLIKAKQIEEVTEASSIIERLINLTNETMDIYRAVKKAKDYDLALKALARAEKQAELQAKLLGELQQEGQVNIFLKEEWTTVEAVIYNTLEPYPEIKAKVLEGFKEAKNVNR